MSGPTHKSGNRRSPEQFLLKLKKIWVWNTYIYSKEYLWYVLLERNAIEEENEHQFLL
jgi:hypothetical protein